MKYETLAIHFSYFIQNSCFINAVERINHDILWLFVWMPTPAQNVKSKKRDAKREKSDTKYPAIHFSFFASRNKCTASPRFIFQSIFVISVTKNDKYSTNFFYILQYFTNCFKQYFVIFGPVIGATGEDLRRPILRCGERLRENSQSCGPTTAGCCTTTMRQHIQRSRLDSFWWKCPPLCWNSVPLWPWSS